MKVVFDEKFFDEIDFHPNFDESVPNHSDSSSFPRSPRDLPQYSEGSAIFGLSESPPSRARYFEIEVDLKTVLPRQVLEPHHRVDETPGVPR